MADRTRYTERAELPAGSPALRFMGIDPGLASTGYGVVEISSGCMRALGYGVIHTRSEMPHSLRIRDIHAAIADLLGLWSPDRGGMESLFFFRNVSSALPVAEARGVIRLAFVSAGIHLDDLTPNEIKLSVTGSARAEKKQVQEMVRILLGLPDIPKPDHAADALAAAICLWHKTGPIADLVR